MNRRGLMRAAGRGALALALVCGALGSQAAPDAALKIAGSGPYYRLSLPLTWQALSAPGDLADLRVMNAAGESLPYAWLEAPDPVAVERETALAWFKWEGPRQGHTSSKASEPVASPSSPSWPIWVLDARQVKGRLQRLVLDLPSEPQGVFAVALEASDDLQHWSTVSDSVQLASLSHQGQRLLQDTIELGGLPPAYLRLRLLPGSPAPDLGRALLVSSQTAVSTPSWSWSSGIRAAQCGPGYCDYPVPSNVPLGRLKVRLAQANSLLSLSVKGQSPVLVPSELWGGQKEPYHPHHGLRARVHALRGKWHDAAGAGRQGVRDAGWAWVGEGQVYWIVQSGRTSRSEELLLDHGRYKALRLSTAGGDDSWTKVPPEIEVATWSRSLVFLARGGGPYRLAWADAKAGHAALSMAQLMPGNAGKGFDGDGIGVAVLPELVQAGTGVAGAPGSAVPKPAHPGGRTWGNVPAAWWLWAALLLGLGLLAYLVRSVLAGPASPSE